MTSDERAIFLETLWGFYARSARKLPWREPAPGGGFDPFKIMVSELMLQQTQVTRVIPKYQEFMQRFPTAEALARAELGEVLRAWQGLGYNRRAKYLHEAAKAVRGLKCFPDTPENLTALPGVGLNTAGAILAYAYDQPAVFVETNIRTVFLHHFFPGQTNVSDKEVAYFLARMLSGEEGKEQLRDLAEPNPGAMRKTVALPQVESPREFYWALMDYGSHLKATVGNVGAGSKHYAKQSRFEGSRRQVRGRVLRVLGGGSKTALELRELVGDERLESVLADLVAEGLVRELDGTYAL